MNPKKLRNPAELEDPDCKNLRGFGPFASKACARTRGTLILSLLFVFTTVSRTAGGYVYMGWELPSNQRR
jgi:hypothetical protein